MYAAEGERAVFLLLLLMVFLFGVLRFGTRTLLACAFERGRGISQTARR